MELFSRILNMNSILCLLLIGGVVAVASGQMQGQAAGPDVLGDNKMLFVDPLMEVKCQKKGINVKELNQEMAQCVQAATMTYIQSGKLKNMGEAFTVVCRIREPMEPCIKKFVTEVQECYDNEEEKKEVGKAKDVLEASFNYMCKDDAQEMIDVFTNMDNIQCIGKMAEDPQRAMKCVADLQSKIHPDKMHLQNEETCLVTYKSTRCMLDPLKACDSMDTYNFFRGMIDATLRASTCEQYVGHLLSSAAAPSYSLWMFLAVSFALVFFKF